MSHLTLTQAHWIERCAWYLVRAVPDFAPDEANTLARKIYEFERTSAMPPEAAVDFVAQQIAHADAPDAHAAGRAGPRG